jgi:hypothetical protein
MTVTLDPPRPVTQLQATVVPQLTARATVLGDLLNAFGMDPDQIRIAQQGYADGAIIALTVRGIGYDGFVADEATLRFDEIVRDATISVDMSGGRSMTEAISRVLAHAIMYSVTTMKRKGLRITYWYHFAPHAPLEQTRARYGLQAGTMESYAPGHGPRRLFEITPGADSGIHYAHYVTRRIG